MRLRCIACGKGSGLEVDVCSCGGPLDLDGFDAKPDAAAWNGRGVWRFADALPLPAADAVSLGEGATPLVRAAALGARFKLEYLSPTGSFKDRGATMVATQAGRLRAGGEGRGAGGEGRGARGVVEDSSGNAGAAVAAYAARAGLPCTIVMPDYALAAKEEAVRALGAEVVRMQAPRAEITRRTIAMARDRGLYYASHVYTPWFLHGTKTVAYELFEELGPHLCDAIVTPAAQGSLLLGVHLGLRELEAAGLVGRVPRLYAVQAAGTAPVAEALGVAGPPGERNALPDGLLIAEPPRLAQMVAAVRGTGGSAVVVGERETREALARLHGAGLLVEPTSATALAGLERLRASGAIRASEDVAVLLTGRFKSPPPAKA